MLDLPSVISRLSAWHVRQSVSTRNPSKWRNGHRNQAATRHTCIRTRNRSRTSCMMGRMLSWQPPPFLITKEAYFLSTRHSLLLRILWRHRTRFPLPRILTILGCSYLWVSAYSIRRRRVFRYPSSRAHKDHPSRLWHRPSIRQTRRSSWRATSPMPITASRPSQWRGITRARRCSSSRLSTPALAVDLFSDSSCIEWVSWGISNCSASSWSSNPRRVHPIWPCLPCCKSRLVQSPLLCSRSAIRAMPSPWFSRSKTIAQNGGSTICRMCCVQIRQRKIAHCMVSRVWMRISWEHGDCWSIRSIVPRRFFRAHLLGGEIFRVGM